MQLLPFLAFTALGGSLTDRIGARLSFAAATGLFALTLAVYGLAEPVIGFQPLAFGTYCLISGLLSALSNPAIDTFIPEATPKGAGQNALIAATVHNLAKLSGNAATLLLPLLSAVGGFVANGALMAVSVLFLLRHPLKARTIRPPQRDHAPARVMAHFRAHPESFDIVLGSVRLGTFVIPGFYIFHPLVMRESFAGQAGLMGLTGIIGWVGAILASSLALRLGARIRHPWRLALGVWTLAACGFMCLGVVREFWVLLILLFFLGGNSLGKALIYGQFLRSAPEADRALLIGVDQTAFWGFATLGTLALGGLVDRIGFHRALLVNSGVILGCVLLLALRGRLWRLGQA